MQASRSATRSRGSLAFLRSRVAHPSQSPEITRIALRLVEEVGSLVSAEGTETTEQLGRLEAMGYRDGQGNRLTAPMPAETIAVWIDQWQPSPFGGAEAESPPRRPILH
ncbi:MAG: hypothetical protein WBG92_11540 [Thiohalocapsa sp.]